MMIYTEGMCTYILHAFSLCKFKEDFLYVTYRTTPFITAIVAISITVAYLIFVNTLSIAATTKHPVRT